MSPKMRKLLIIEDERNDFTKISKIFKNHSWELIPQNEDIFFQWKNILESCDEKKIVGHYESIVCDNFNEIGLILLDLALTGGDDKFGIKVLEMIRTENISDSEKLSRWRKTIPIFALSKYTKKDYITSAQTGKYTADNYFIKDNVFQVPLTLIYTAEVAYTNFLCRRKEGNPEYNFENLSNKLDAIKEEVVTQFIQLQSYLEPRLSEIDIIKSNLSSLICGQLKMMGPAKAEKFVSEFSKEFSSLEPKYQTNIQELLENPKFKENFAKLIQNGDLNAFTDLLDKLFIRLESAGVISSLPILKFILPGLLALLKIVSHKD